MLTHRNFYSQNHDNVAEILRMYDTDVVVGVLPLYHVYGLSNGLVSSVYFRCAISLICTMSPPLSLAPERFRRNTPGLLLRRGARSASFQRVDLLPALLPERFRGGCAFGGGYRMPLSPGRRYLGGQLARILRRGKGSWRISQALRRAVQKK